MRIEKAEFTSGARCDVRKICVLFRLQGGRERTNGRFINKKFDLRASCRHRTVADKVTHDS